MARIDSLSILGESSGKDKLAESYGKVIENIEKTTISAMLKNKDLSGDPTTGTVEAKRFENTDSKAYGTARSGGGDKLKAKPVVVSIGTDKELINEVEEKDVRLYGVDGLIQRKSAMDQRSMARELERAFFDKAKTSAGITTQLKSTAINEQVEEAIQLVEKVKNKFVDGVPRDLIHVVLDTELYGKMRDFLDTTQNSNVDTAQGEFGMFHGVMVHSTVYLPADTKMLVMVEGAVAQPVLTWLDDADKFPASNAWHFGMFYSYGTEAVMPDLIYKGTFPSEG